MKKKWIIVLIIILGFIINIFDIQSVNAQKIPLNMKLEADSKEVKNGSEISVSLIVTGWRVENFETELEYDSNILEFVKGDNSSKVSDGKIRVKGAVDGEVENKFNLTFKAKAEGRTKISTKGLKSAIDDSDPENEGVNVKDDSIEIKCINENGAEQLFNIKELKLVNTSENRVVYDLTDKIKPDTTSFSAEVDNDCENVSILVVCDNKNIKFKDDKVSFSLKEGNNSLKFTLEDSESKETKEYTISVYRKDSSDMQRGFVNNEEPDTDDEGENNNRFEKLLEVRKEKGNVYLKGHSYSYKLLDLDDKSMLPDGFEEKEVNICGKEIKAYNYKGTDEEYVLLYAQNMVTEDKGFYLYDKEEKTLQRFNDSLDIRRIKKKGNALFDMIGEENAIIFLIISILLILTIGSAVYVHSLYARLKGFNVDMVQAHEEAQKQEEAYLLEEKKKLEEKRIKLAKKKKLRMLKEILKMNIEAEQSEIEDSLAKQIAMQQEKLEKEEKEKKQSSVDDKEKNSEVKANDDKKEVEAKNSEETKEEKAEVKKAESKKDLTEEKEETKKAESKKDLTEEKEEKVETKKTEIKEEIEEKEEKVETQEPLEQA